MKLIVGLGNPGKEYSSTRHNVGFSFLDYYLNAKKILEKWSKKFDGEYIQTTIGNEKIIFLPDNGPLIFDRLATKSPYSFL